jgi:hypothetical protein
MKRYDITISYNFYQKIKIKIKLFIIFIVLFYSLVILTKKDKDAI